MTFLLLLTALATPPPPVIGREVTVTRPTVGTVVSLAGDVVVDAEVTGDVVAVAGDIVIRPGGRVDGDAVALGGVVDGDGAVAGRVVTTSLITARRRGRPVPGAASLGVGLLRAGAWILVVTGIVLAAPRLVRSIGTNLLDLGWRAVLAGAGALLAWLAAMILALMAGAWSLGKLLVLAGVLALVVVKVVGLTVVAWAAGLLLARGLPVALRGELPRAGIGAIALLGLTAVPVLGETLWLLANVVGFGAVAATAVRRRLRLAPAFRLPPR